jgi:hypothetical protein
MSETGFKVLVVLWLLFGLVSIVLLFRRGLARNLLRTFAERYGAAALGWVVIVLLMPIMLVAGTIAFLMVMVSEEKVQCKKCVTRYGLLDPYCSNCERTSVGTLQAA